jgi:hypothetical protein
MSAAKENGAWLGLTVANSRAVQTGQQGKGSNINLGMCA